MLLNLLLALPFFVGDTNASAPLAHRPTPDEFPAPVIPWQAGNAGELVLEHFGQHLTARLRSDGLHVVAEGALCMSDEPVSVVLRTTSFGWVGAAKELAPGVVSNGGTRARIERKGIVEWFEAHAQGIEQGWTIGAPPPAEKGAKELWIGLEFNGLFPRITEDGLGAFLVDHGGRNRMRYVGLVARDAVGRKLNARIASASRGVGVLVNVDGASFPVEVDPILGPDAWSFSSGQSSTFLSRGSTAGDVNGDGYSDLILGAPSFRVTGAGNSEDHNGRAWIFYGSSTGLGTPVLTLTGANDGDALGKTVTALGDIDQDGFEDVAIGAPGTDVGAITQAGRVHVYRGSASGLLLHWALDGSVTSGRMGAAQYAGDLDGDGRADLLVWNEIQGPDARLFVYRGTGSASPGTPILTLRVADFASYGVVPEARFLSASGIGDLNADGYADFAVALDKASPDDGKVFVILGSSLGPALPPTWVLDPISSNADDFGARIRLLGDLQGDGHADFAVFEPNNRKLFLFAGAATGAPLPIAFGTTFTSAETAPAGAGDIDGDSLPDLVVGSPSNGPESIRIWRGAPAGLQGSFLTILAPGGSGSRFGTETGTAGDVNGDGRSDVFAIAPRDGPQNEGIAYVYHGQPPDPPLVPPSSGAVSLLGTNDAHFGTSVALNGDANGDGYSDLLVGAPTYLDNGIPTGRVELHLGGPNGINPLPSWSFPPPGPGFANHQIGASVSFAGDVNSDGFTDLVVGAPGTSNGQANEGRAYVFYGNAGGNPSTIAGQFWFYESNELDAAVGFAVSNAGDINGDGYPDVAIGAPGRHLGDLNRGAVYVFHGSTTGLGSTPARVLDAGGPASDSRFGSALASAGDVNQDGLSDLVVGAPDANGSFLDEGAAYLYVGTASGLSPTPVSVGFGGLADARFGATVGAGGDINRDGLADVIVGAPAHDAATTGGRVHVYLGQPGPAPDVFATPTQTIVGAQAQGDFGSAIGGIGDLDNDGFSDLVLGARRYDGSGVDSGRLYVYLGTSTGLALPAAQTIDGSTGGDGLGGAIASAGDWNGDGFSDIIGAQPEQNGGWGGLVIYSGTTSGGSSYKVQQRRVNAQAANDLLCLVDSPTSLYLDSGVDRGNGVTGTVAGRERVQLEYELDEFANLLDGAGLVRTAAVDSGPIGGTLRFHELATTLQPGRGYHWRSRQRLGNPFFPHTLWQSMQGNGKQEKKLGTGFDCNNNGIEDGAETQANPAIDCNANRVPDSCDIATGSDPDCDNDGTPNSCELFANDCDGDLCPDDCELVGSACSGSGVAEDCNANNVLDNCEIVQNPALDANGNGRLDSCEFIPYCFGDGTGTACPCGNSGGLGRGCANSVNANGALLTVSGIPSTFNDTVVLHGSGMPNSVNPSAIYLQGTLRDNGGLGTPLNDGLRCVTGSLVRLGTKPNTGGASQYPDVGNLPVSIRGGIPSGGGTYHYQVFYRNAAAAFCPPGTANWSNAVSIVWIP